MPELLPNWRSATAADGKEYYFNELTGETSWTFPTADAAPAEVPPAASPAPPADLSQGGADALSVAVDVAPPIVQTFRAEADSPALGVASSLGGAGAHTHGLGPTHGLGGGLTFSTPNVLKALEGKLFQLISLFLSSFVLLLVACIDYGGHKMYVSGAGDQPYPRSLGAYSISVGMVSIGTIVGYFLMARYKSAFLDSYELSIGSSSLNAAQIVSTFLFVWWFIAVGILTFHGPYTATSNAYFSLWVSTAISMNLLSRAYSTVQSKMDQFHTEVREHVGVRSPLPTHTLPNAPR